MNVLQLCIRFKPATGGAETHVYSISSELKRRAHFVKVFTSDLHTETPFARSKHSPNLVDGIPVCRFRAYSPGGELHYVFMPSMITRLLREEADIMHAHSYGYFHVNLASWARLFNGIPLVFTPHFHPYWSMVGGAKRKKVRRFYDRFISKWVLNNVDVLIGVSHHEIALMKAVGIDEAKVRIVPNGIDFARFEHLVDGELFRDRFDINDELILFTGRLASNKGLDVLIASIPKVLTEFPRAKFALAGEDQGMKAKLIVQARKAGVLDRVLFPGHLDEELFLSAYTACDCFVLPSEYEAFGIVLLEAMASEKACVATNVGGIPEALGACGILVEYGDANSLARALIELLGDAPRRRALGERGRERVRSRFTWDKVVDQLEEIYEGLV